LQPNPVVVSLGDWETEDGGGEFIDVDDDEVDDDDDDFDDIVDEDDDDDGDDDDDDDDDVDDDIDTKYGEGEKEKDNHCITVCERDDICNVCGEKDVISDSVIVEWVQCDVCDCWQHERCAGVVGLGESDMFVCINCRNVLHQ